MYVGKVHAKWGRREYLSSTSAGISVTAPLRNTVRRKKLFPPFSKLPEIFEKFPDIMAVYLFGSVATGNTHAESDLDLAVVPRRGASLDKLDILTELARHGFDNVDLVILDTNDIVLKYEAVKHNKVIYATEDFDPGAMFSLIVREYLDFLPYLERQRKAYKERILGGKSGGHTPTAGRFGEHLEVLKSLQRYSEEEFFSTPERYGSAERFLQLSIEALSDIGGHVVAGLHLGSIDWYSDIPERLHEAGYIDAEMRDKWIKMIGFRNVLVHDYLDLDRKVVYRVLHENLGDIEALRDVLAQFL